jgi:hypothetical protein
MVQQSSKSWFCCVCFCPVSAEAGTCNVSRSLEDSLTWHLVLLGSAVGGLRPQYAAPLVKDLEQIVDDTLQVRPAAAAAAAAARCSHVTQIWVR